MYVGARARSVCVCVCVCVCDSTGNDTNEGKTRRRCVDLALPPKENELKDQVTFLQLSTHVLLVSYKRLAEVFANKSVVVLLPPPQ